DEGCGVALPNISAPLSTVPLPFLSRTSHASSPATVQDTLPLAPSLLKSKSTPSGAPVIAKPLPRMSMRIGLTVQQEAISGKALEAWAAILSRGEHLSPFFSFPRQLHKSPP